MDEAGLINTSKNYYEQGMINSLRYQGKTNAGPKNNGISDETTYNIMEIQAESDATLRT
jgi:hypothetical protein